MKQENMHQFGNLWGYKLYVELPIEFDEQRIAHMVDKCEHFLDDAFRTNDFIKTLKGIFNSKD